MSTPDWAAHLPDGVAPEDVDLVADGSLPAAWVRRWVTRPTADVLHHPDDGSTSAEELEARTRDIAGRYAAAGLRRGDHLLLSAAPSAQLVAAYVAALRLGLVVVPLNTAYTADEVGHVVADGDARLAVVDDDTRGRWIRDRAAAEGRDVTVVGTDVALPSTPGGPVDLDAVGLDDPALLVYTSGTTGRPKGAPLTHRNLLASARAVGIAWRWEPDDRLVLTLPLFHLHGLGVGINGSLTAGATILLRPGFHPADVVDSAAELGGSMFFGVPTMYRRLAAHPGASGLSTLRLCVSGSAPLPADLWHEIEQVTGQRVLERYGMTEVVMAVSNPYDGERRPGAVGFPLPGVRTRVDEATGELHLRGPNVFGGYWRRPEATAEAFDDAGWFATGDLVERDPDGYLRITGRSKDLIISGGYNVSPREVEEALEAHPSVREAAAIGVPSAEWGEEVTAVVVLEGDVADGVLDAWVRGRLAPYKRPKRYRVVDELPRNALGKVQRHLLDR